MEIYATKSKSLPQKLAVNAGELVLLFVSYFILFSPASFLLIPWNVALQPTHPERRFIIFLFSIIVFLRMGYMMFFLLKRKLSWAEAFVVLIGYAIYYVGFSLLVLPVNTPIDTIDYFAIALFFAGSFINSYSEIQRDRWKQDSENRGHLYTEGLFEYSMHINFFGDLLWVTAYAIITRNIYSAPIPIALFFVFVFYNIPKLDSYLAQKYADEFKDYEGRTKRFIPFVY